MLRPGLVVVLARSWQRPALIRVIGRGTHPGLWVGRELGRTRGRDGIEPIRSFRPGEVRACQKEDGFQAILPGIF